MRVTQGSFGRIQVPRLVRTTIAIAALILASCGIEAAEQSQQTEAPQQKSPAEALAEKFAGPAPTTPRETPAQRDPGIAGSRNPAAALGRLQAKPRKAEPASETAQADERARADEAEMLVRARAEAEQRRGELEAAQRRIAEQQAAERASAERAKRVEEERLASENAAIAAAKAAAAQKIADDLRISEQNRIADQARLAEERRIADEQQNAAARQAAEDKRIADEQQKRMTAETERQALARRELQELQARRDADARMLAERLRAAEATREAKSEGTETSTRGPGSAPTIRKDVASSGEIDRPVAVLLVMEPGTKGIRRFDKSADPVLCVGDNCYVSEGSSEVARRLPRSRVLGIANTWGQRAGACQHSLTCVFRGVDLAGHQVLQPVDMKVLVHDRREARTVERSSDCRLDGVRLNCRQPIQGAGYRMWIVPEALAAEAGPTALKAALAAGLPESTSAGLAR